MELTATVQSTERPTKSNVSVHAHTGKSYEQIFFEKTGKNFNQYYAKYYPKLVWSIQKMTINSIDSEDLANQAFMQSLEKINDYKPEYQFSTWLFTIGKRMAYQYKKDAAKEICVDLSADGSDDDNFDPVQTYLKSKMDTYVDTIEQTLDYHTKSNRKYAETMKEIMKLDAKYRVIIELSDIQGKSYNEICEQLGKELGKTPEQQLQTVKNRLHHGRLRLEKNLKQKFAIIQEQY